MNDTFKLTERDKAIAGFVVNFLPLFPVRGTKEGEDESYDLEAVLKFIESNLPLGKAIQAILNAQNPNNIVNASGIENLKNGKKRYICPKCKTSFKGQGFANHVRGCKGVKK